MLQIADFGVSEEIVTSDAHLTRSAGTPAFIAPECLEGKYVTGRSPLVWKLFCMASHMFASGGSDAWNPLFKGAEYCDGTSCLQ